tara:strand:- start:2722 stop:3501 length:780 start_codon:yes stop_codon:yes gene_type:complete
MLFSIFITPFALNKSRLLLGNDNVTSFLPTIKVQQFNDSFNGLTFIVDDKTENRIKNIFLQDTSNVLKSITTNEAKNSTTTIIAGDGLIEGKKMILFNGKIITSNQEDKENDIIKFEQLSFDLNNIQSTTIKQPKIQETSTISLIDCYKENKIKNSYCKKNYKEEILPVLNRRIILPFFIPVIALLSSLLLIKTKKNIFLNKISIFFYCFLILLYAELIIRYTGLSNVVNNFFLISPIIFSIISYIFLKFKFSKELNTK